MIFYVGKTAVEILPKMVRDGDSKERVCLQYKSGMAIEADGAPNAYAPKGSGIHTLDVLGNAGKPGNWYGIVTDTDERDGEPIIQGSKDPFPGAYVSHTKLRDKSRLRTDPRAYVDAGNVPYIAIAPELQRQGVYMGDVAWVQFNDLACGAIVADVGPRGRLGEGSIALAKTLGIPHSPINGGVNFGVTYTIFCNSRCGWPRATAIFQTQAQSLFEQLSKG